MKRLRDVLWGMAGKLSLEERMVEAEVRRAFALLPEAEDLEVVYVDPRRGVIGLAYASPRERGRWQDREEELLQRLNRMVAPREFREVHWMLRHRPVVRRNTRGT